MVEREKIEPMLALYRVLDLTDEKGFYCGQLLGSLGADVIKIERPGGDSARNIGPFFHNIPDPEESLPWFALNSNKRGITLDIEAPDGREIFKKLVKTADVVVESFVPGYMGKLGLAYSELEKINPGVVMTSITPFGHTGPYRDYKASDLVCWAMGGLLAQSGDPDRPPVRISHINFAFLMASLDAAWSTVFALYWRGRSGKGQYVDVSIQESMAKTVFLAHETWEVSGREQQRAGPFYRVARSDVKLRAVWPVKDGYITFLIFGGRWGATHDNPPLAKWIDEEGLADDFLRGIDWPELSWRRKSQEEVEQIHDYFARFFKTKTKRELANRAARDGIILAPSSTVKDLVEKEQLNVRSYWIKVEHPELGEAITYPGAAVKASAAPWRIYRRAPLIGEHNEEVYIGELGFTREQFPALKARGII